LRLPRWKKLLYGLLMAVTCLVLLEALLAVAGVKPLTSRHDPFVGFSAALPHFEERAAIGEPPRMRTARNKLSYLNDQNFAAKKPTGTFRIFCLGDSTTYGQPYDDPTSYVGWLRTLLVTASPSQAWEVVNAGGISYASYRVAALMEELVRYEPDLFVVYTGHNEFLEERTYRDVLRTSSTRRWLTLLAAGTRTGAAMHRLLGSPSHAPPVELSADVETMLDRSVGPTSYERDDELRRQIVAHFAVSLRQMIDRARAAGVEIVFIRPASNLKDCGPFLSRPDEGLTDAQRLVWQEHVEAGRSLQAAGRHQDAVREFEEALDVDDWAAEVHYLHGQSLQALERYDESEAALVRAVDEDVCPLRMTSDLAAAFDGVVAERGALALDYHQILRDASRIEVGHAVLGAEYFLDHVHPTIEAHGMLAAELARRLWQAGLLPGDGDLSQATIDASARRVHDQVDPVAHAHAEAELARVLFWAGKQDEAGPLALKSLAYNEDDPRVWLIAGIHLQRLGKTEEAVAHLERALELSPEDLRIRNALDRISKESRERGKGGEGE
jgi:tetratricopeptide (TPR) repeat protein